MHLQIAVGGCFASEDAAKFDGMNDQRARVFDEDTPLALLDGVKIVSFLTINKDRYPGEIARICTQEIVNRLVWCHTRIQRRQDVV